MCVDLTHLNKCVHRKRPILPSADHTLTTFGGTNVFTKLGTLYVTDGVSVVCHMDDKVVHCKEMQEHNTRLKCWKDWKNQGWMKTLNEKYGFGQYYVCGPPYLCRWCNSSSRQGKSYYGDARPKRQEFPTSGAGNKPKKESFQRLKSELSSTRVLVSYSPTAMTCIAVPSGLLIYRDWYSN